jgi:hypothetical protein
MKWRTYIGVVAVVAALMGTGFNNTTTHVTHAEESISTPTHTPTPTATPASGTCDDFHCG